MNKHRLELTIIIIVFAVLPIATAFAQTGTPPTQTPTSTLVPTATLTVQEDCAVNGVDSVKCRERAIREFSWLGWVLLGVVVIGVGAVALFAKGMGSEVEGKGKSFAQKLFSPPQDLTRHYLEKFIDDNKNPKFQSLKALARDVQMPELQDIYVPARLVVEVTEAERATLKGKGKKEREGNVELIEGRMGERQSPVTLIEAMGKGAASLAVIGIAGSGKSTELQWAGLACARAILKQKLSKEQKEFIAALGGSPLTPIFFPLGAFDRYCQRKKNGLRTTSALLEFATERFNQLHDNKPLPADFFAKKLKQGCLLLFDGVDEVEPDHRGAVRAAVQGLLSDYPHARARSLLTSRPAAYFGEAQAANFRKCEVQPMTDDQRDELIRGLHRAMHAPDEDKAKRESQDLSRRIDASDERVRVLAQTPLLTTIFALVHKAKRQLPQQRAELYEEAVTTLLEESYRKDDVDLGTRTASESDPNLRRDRLSLIAFYLHDKRVGDDGMPENDLIDLIWEKFGSDKATAREEAKNFMHGIANRGGLLEEQDRRFGFRSHRTFQEFLASRYLVRGYAPFDLKKQGKYIADRLKDDHWEEPLRLAAGYLAIGGEGEVEQFIKLIADLGGDDVTGDRASAVAGLSLSDLPASHLRQPNPTRLKIIKEMLNVLERNPPRLEIPLRRRLGLALSTIGDPRFNPPLPLGEELGARVKSHFITIPAGKFLMGTSDDEAQRLKEQGADSFGDEKPQHAVYVSAFGIGKYPVTNIEYRAFVDDKGYEKESYWSERGKSWLNGSMDADLSFISDEDTKKRYKDWLASRPKEKRNQPFFWDDPQWNADTLPVVGVTWFEAEAYCQWLTNKLRQAKAITDTQEIRLPREAEWEKAARAQRPTSNLQPLTSRLWSWGDTWDATKCNSSASNFNGTTPVGMYPNGASDYGVQDMMGNVWEWCADWWDDGLYASRKDQEVRDPLGAENGSTRVVRGGSWFANQLNCRSAFRGRDTPLDFSDGIGFRLLLSPVVGLDS